MKSFWSMANYKSGKMFKGGKRIRKEAKPIATNTVN